MNAPTLLSRRSLCAFMLLVLPALPALSLAAAKSDYVLLVLCDAAPGQDATFDSWWPGYLRSMAAVPGVQKAEDFRRSDNQIREGVQSLPHYLAVFAISSRDLAATYRDINQRVASGKIALSPAMDRSSLHNFSYRRRGDWHFAPPATPGKHFIQMVFADPNPGQEDEFNRWYEASHVPQLKAVPGVIEIERSVRVDVPLFDGANTTTPAYLSDMRLSTPSIAVFKEGLERVAKGFTDTKAYDINKAWRGAYERVGEPIKGKG